MTIGRGDPPVGPQRGGVYLVVFPEVGGHVQAGRRPAVVVQADRFARSGTVVVCPMTSNPPPDDRPRPHRMPVAARESGLDRDGWVKADQLSTVPAATLQGPVGRLSPDALGRLEAALRFVLDLP